MAYARALEEERVQVAEAARDRHQWGEAYWSRAWRAAIEREGKAIRRANVMLCDLQAAARREAFRDPLARIIAIGKEFP